MATQRFKRNLLLNLYREEKISLVCFLLLLKKDKNVWHLQPISSVWRPLAFLPVTLSLLLFFFGGGGSFFYYHYFLLKDNCLQNFVVFSQTSTWISQVQFGSVSQSCPTLCDPMNRSMPGLPVHHQLPEFTQTHAHQVDDAIQPSHPLSSPSPPAFNLC